MKLTDGKNVIEISMNKWEGNGYSPDWADEFFECADAKYNEEMDAYNVPDLQYCLDEAQSWEQEDEDNNLWVEIVRKDGDEAGKDQPEYKEIVEIANYDGSNKKVINVFDGNAVRTAKDCWNEMDNKDDFDPRHSPNGCGYIVTASVYMYHDANGSWTASAAPVIAFKMCIDEETPYFAEKYAEEE